MRTIQTNVFGFSELPDQAKKNAIENYRSLYSDNFWSEAVINDAAHIADLLGIDLRQTLKTRRDKSIFYAPTIFYSGFCSQGDGASFEGSYAYKKGYLMSVKSYAPMDTTLHDIAKALQDLQRKNFYSLTAKMKHQGFYYHSGCMRVDVNSANGASVSDDTEEELTQIMRNFADWIYIQLEQAYEYANSDNYIIETMQANEYEFTDKGVISWS